jgi:hypothetical protein
MRTKALADDPGIIARQIFRVVTYNPLPPPSLRKPLFVLITFAVITTLPGFLGAWSAMTKQDFTVIDRGKPYEELVLSVYGDKAFIGQLEDDTVSTVEVVDVADLKGKPMWIEPEFGLLKSRVDG